jgi:peptidoglycan/xylan/chitin deacetylase (PgdA/CDA1 family)
MWRILCYHDVPESCEANFRNQLISLRDRGWKFVGVSDGIGKLRSKQPGRWMSITFDDGDLTGVAAARIVRETVAAPVCIYVSTDFIQRGCNYRTSSAIPTLTWSEIRSLCDAGNEIGSHTHTHAPLPLCSTARFDQEVGLSKTILEQKISAPVRHFSYPWGQYDATTQKRLQSLGLYQSHASIDRGPMAASTELLKRDAIDPRWPPVRLRLTLAWGATALYQIRRRYRPKFGYWTEHPEESWQELR